MTPLDAYMELSMVPRRLKRNKKIDLAKYEEALDVLSVYVRRHAHIIGRIHRGNGPEEAPPY